MFFSFNTTPLNRNLPQVAVENTVKEMSNRRSEEVAGKWLQVTSPSSLFRFHPVEYL